MTAIVHYRHGAAIEKAKRAMANIHNELQYIVIVYDGANVPKPMRQASYASDAPDEDVKAVCRAIADSEYA